MAGKKILFFIGAAYVSGLEVITLHLLKGLKDEGYDLRCVINGWGDGVFKKKLEELGIPYDEVKLGWIYFRKPAWTLDSLVNYPKAYFKCKKIIKRYQPDVVHFCNYNNPVLLFPLIKKNSLYALHETHLPSRKHNLIYGLLNKKITIFTAVSEHIKRTLQNLAIPENKIRLIYNGIPIRTNYENSTTAASSRESVFEFAIIGQVVEWKGHGTLLAAVEKIVQDGTKDFKVSIYGNDKTDYGKSLKEEMEKKKLENWFEWKGFVSSKDEIYKSCSVVVVPSLSEEPCSITVIEAMSEGKGLIVSDRGGNPELVQHQVNGLIFKAGDPLLLAQCMEDLIGDRSKIDELGRKAREKAVKEYSVREMTQRHIQAYNEITSD